MCLVGKDFWFWEVNKIGGRQENFLTIASPFAFDPVQLAFAPAVASSGVSLTGCFHSNPAYLRGNAREGEYYSKYQRNVQFLLLHICDSQLTSS